MNKTIEEKAINYLKTFIEDSEVISQHISENDKEPCWDGHLYLYSEGIQDKNHLQGRVPVQIKGTEVKKFNIDNFKFKVNKNDLKAYLYEPTLYIVVQIKKDSKERKLFYIELLPEIVKNILNDMGEHNSKKIQFKPLKEDLSEFEKQLWAFMWNSKRMISFAGKKHLTIEDVVKKRVKSLSFVKPLRVTNEYDLLRYLSSHETYIYGKPIDFDIDIPIMDAPVKMTFTKNMDKIVKVKDTVFYENCKSEIKNGIERVLVGNILEIWMAEENPNSILNIRFVDYNPQTLKEIINYAEFMIALNDHKILTIGEINIPIKTFEINDIERFRLDLDKWKKIQNVFG